MDLLEAYVAARERRDEAQAQLQLLARRLRQLAALLAHPNGVRLKSPSEPAPKNAHQAVFDERDWLSWAQVEPAIAAFMRADEEWHRLDAALTPDQRRRLNQRTGGSST
jgi:hypothetical protein